MVINILLVIIVLVILYLLAIMPKLIRNPGHKALSGWLYAHRGIHKNKSEAPENSIVAFQRAIDNHFGIELDVQLTKDQVPVVIHDYNLKRICGVDLKVREVTYEELQQYKLFKSKEKIPTLKEALDCIQGKVPIIVELKIPWGAASTCEAASKLLNEYNGIYCIESFNPFGLMWYRRHYPKIIRGQLATDFKKEKIVGNKYQYFILKHLLFNFLTKPDFIAYQHIYKKDISFSICRRLYRTKTAAWTIKKEEELLSSKRYFDLFIFDSFIPKR